MAIKSGSKGSTKGSIAKKISSRLSSIDALTLLKQDHKSIEGLFKQFEKLVKKTDRNEALDEKEDIKDDVLRELAIHSAIEEQLFYPAAREALMEDDEAPEIIFEALEEHHVMKSLLSELQSLEADAERFEAKMKVLIETVRMHIREEEAELFPQVRQALGRRRLLEMGGMLEEAKSRVGIKIEPNKPDTPPQNLTPETQGLFQKTMDLIRS